MTKVRLLSYTHNTALTDKIIAGWTYPRHPNTPPASHSELGLYLNKYDVDKINHSYNVNLVSGWNYYSSTTRNRSEDDKKSNGCRWISEGELLNHPERWRCLEGEIARDKYDIMLEANSYIGSRYDWAGIFGFATPFGLINDKDKWYCSEVCYKLITSRWVRRISPRGLIVYCLEIGFQENRRFIC